MSTLSTYKKFPLGKLQINSIFFIINFFSAFNILFFMADTKTVTFLSKKDLINQITKEDLIKELEKIVENNIETRRSFKSDNESLSYRAGR